MSLYCKLTKIIYYEDIRKKAEDFCWLRITPVVVLYYFSIFNVRLFSRFKKITIRAGQLIRQRAI